MRYDLIRKRPVLASGILAVGVVVYWLVQQPRLWTLADPLIDPYWIVMSWVWFVPIAVSAIFDSHRRRRFWLVLAYAILTGLLAARRGYFVVPVIPLPTALVALPLFLVVNLGLALLAEGISQDILKHLRRFDFDGWCHACGRVLFDEDRQSASCPRCEAPPSMAWGADEPDEPGTPRDRPTGSLRFGTVVTAACFLIPPVYFHLALSDEAALGRVAAGQDWSQGAAIFPLRPTDVLAPQFHVLWSTGPTPVRLDVLPVPFELKSRARAEAYRTVIDRQLRQAGLSRLPIPLLDPFEVNHRLSWAKFAPVGSLPFSAGAVSLAPGGPGRLRLSFREWSAQIAVAEPIEQAAVEGPVQMLALRIGQGYWTFLEYGGMAQLYYTSPQFGLGPPVQPTEFPDRLGIPSGNAPLPIDPPVISR